ncbi:MAG: penicillin-binding transpeptidase domain-containing protein [Caulobacteraceae bacterium]|nr:penicillin-binding transpeptidase domain-containing protein [Caulobacteraceae bacterium]
MSRAVAGLVLAALVAPILLAGCAPPPRDRFDHDKLNADIDGAIGGLGTCVIILDTQSGRKVYQYGHFDICARALPPCETFEVPIALVGLDAGLVTPQAVVKWDGSPQPTRAWQTDADLAGAFHDSIGWWFGRLAQQIGHDRWATALGAFGYGNKALSGPAGSFWQGPAHGGALALSAGDQAGFMRRLFVGDLAAKPSSAQAVAAALVSETRGGAAMSGVAGSCADQADRGRGVGWWTGRLKSPQRDLTVAAVVEAAEPPPGSDIGDTLKEAFADAGLWPSR